MPLDYESSGIFNGSEHTHVLYLGAGVAACGIAGLTGTAA